MVFKGSEKELINKINTTDNFNDTNGTESKTPEEETMDFIQKRFKDRIFNPYLHIRKLGD